MRLHLLQASPYARTGFAWSARGGNAYAWYWNEAAIESALDAAGLKGRAVHPLPEPLLRAPGPDGFALTRTLDGYEGHFRRNGIIEASTWWPTPPDAAEWERFARDVGGEHAGMPLPRLTQPAWLPQVPTDIKVVRATLGESRVSEPVIYALMITVLGLGAIWLAVEHWRLAAAIAERTAERAELRQKLGHILDTQRAAERDRSAIDVRAANERPLTQLDLLAAIGRMGIGDGQKVQLSEWDYRGDKLRIVLTAPAGQVPRTEYLSRAEQIPGLHNVRLQMENDPKSFSLVADVAQRLEPPDVSDPSAAPRAASEGAAR